ncbi:DUF523 domain-containing protein [bacterium]|nr:DUF523 domain-containing protein [bacterium]
MFKLLDNKPIILAVSHCLLNSKVRANRLSQHPGIKDKILRLAKKYNAKIEQLPCPEFLFLGEREPKTYDEYIEISGFKNSCEKLAKDFISNLGDINECHLIVVGIARSPSCSISYVYDKNNNLKKGDGMFIHCLRKKKSDNIIFLEIDYHQIDISIEKIKIALETAF